MGRWTYVLFGFFVLAVVTLLNIEHISERSGGRSWSSSSGHGSGGSWSSGGGGHK